MTFLFQEFDEVRLVGQDICVLLFQQAALSTSDDVSAESPVQHLQRWEDKHVRLLISCYSKFKNLLGHGKTTKKEVFAKTCTEFNSISEQKVTAEQCMRKWSKLEIKQKEVEDNNKQTGRTRKLWKYHDDMTECMGLSPKINPGFTFDTSSCGSSSTSQSNNDDDDPQSQDQSDGSGDESQEDGQRRKKRAKLPRRKRKSNSSAAEMLQFLQSYSEKKEKVEQEKLALLKSMKDEKKEFYSEFLDLLKKK